MGWSITNMWINPISRQSTTLKKKLSAFWHFHIPRSMDALTKEKPLSYQQQGCSCVVRLKLRIEKYNLQDEAFPFFIIALNISWIMNIFVVLLANTILMMFMLINWWKPGRMVRHSFSSLILFSISAFISLFSFSISLISEIFLLFFNILHLTISLAF